MGFEYELLKRFADLHELELDVKVVYNMDEIIAMLNRGKGDIVAANITVTKDRGKRVSFSESLLKTRQVLIQHRKNPDKISDASELGGRTVHVRGGSSFYDRLLNLEEEIGQNIDIVVVSDSNDRRILNKTIQLIEQVANQEIEFTIADENIARVQKKLYPSIDIDVAISLPQNIAWAMRKPDTLLLQAVNSWLSKEKKKNDYYTIYTKYFRARTVLKKKLKSEYSSLSGGISPYDDLIKINAAKLDWDWRLLASQIYQESKFDPNAQAWTGATGLLQLLPQTAQAYKVDSSLLKDPAANLNAGTSYLAWLDECWAHTITDSLERIKFVLASFNVGLGHVIDARNLAQKYGKDPAKWDNHVAEYILKKSEKEYYRDEVCKHGYCRGAEPFQYVKEVMERYGHYVNLIVEEEAN
tara:strand:- start:9853 stop:11091 length:1239 start_codon:yes stop_codon:yes gene_type:complete